MSRLWINGRLIDKADAKLSPFDHGFLYGDGVWEGLRAFGGKLFRPHEHLNRLSAAASLFEIAIPLSQDELVGAINATLKANDRTDGYVRVIVTRGPGTIGPDPRKLDPQVIVIAEEYQPFPPELYGHGLHAVTAHFPVNVPNPVYWLRALGRPDVVLAKLFALKLGCLEALLKDEAGGLIGATEGELFFVRSGMLYPVPPGSAVASQAVLELARPVMPVGFSAPVRPAELIAADEVFLAGTACGIIGIVRLDGQDIGSGTEGSITKQIRERYQELVRSGG
jgi:branched-chain amino acid aminotransferase